MPDRKPTTFPSGPVGKSGWPWTDHNSLKPIRSRDKSWPKITVITPSFNQADFLEETVRSVLLQGYPNLEYLIIDGASTDGTLEIIKQYENWLDFWVSEPDNGQAEAINKGFLRATGDIVAWLNSDDIYADDKVLFTIADAFMRNPDADVIFGDYLVIDADGLLLRIYNYPSFDYDRMLRCCYIGQPSTFFRKRVIDAHLLDPDLQFAIDYEFWLRLGRTYQFLHINRILSADRNHVGRKMVAQQTELHHESMEVQRKYGQCFGLSYSLGRFKDKFTAGIPARVKGAVQLLFCYMRRGECCYRLDSFFSGMYRQIFKHNRDLF